MPTIEHHNDSDSPSVSGELDFSEYMARDTELPSPNSELGIRLREKLDKELLSRYCESTPEFQPGNANWSVDDWDSYILDEIFGYGAILLLSHRVMTRVYAWQREKGGPAKLRRLGEALALVAERCRRLKKGKITRHHLLLKSNLLPELKRLQDRLRNAWPDTPGAIVSFIRSEIADADKYPRLNHNRTSFLLFLDNNLALATKFLGSDAERPEMSHQRLFYELLAWTEGMSAEHVRQKLSNLAKRR